MALAEYLHDSDFADVLGAGLGALYGLLPTKLSVRALDVDPVGEAMVLGGMASAKPKTAQVDEVASLHALGVGVSSSSDFRASIDLFLKLIEFTQDVLRKSPPIWGSSKSTMSAATSIVASALVDSVLVSLRNIFLAAVVYPSILECTDADGSAVAVLSYIEAMLACIDSDSRLADTILRFLMAEELESVQRRSPPPSSSSSDPAPLSPRSKRLVKRKSTALVILESARKDHPTSYFGIGRFSLRDLLVQNLSSNDQPTATAALKLLRTLLTRHNRYAMVLMDSVPDSQATRLLSIPSDLESDEFIYSPQPPEFGPTPYEKLKARAQELRDLLSLTVPLDPRKSWRADILAGGKYAQYLESAELALTQDSSARRVSTLTPGPPPVRTLPARRASIIAPLDESDQDLVVLHRLDVDSPLLAHLLTGLTRFFAQSPELNLALTGTLASLAACPYRSIRGWLVPSGEVLPADEDLPARRPPVQVGSANGAVFGILKSLVEAVEHYRQTVAGFDRALIERRQGLLFVDNLTDALMDDDAETTLTSTPNLSVESGSPTTIRSDSRRPTSPGAVSLGGSNPFAAHYRRTAAIEITPIMAPSPVPRKPTRPMSILSEDSEEASESVKDEQIDQCSLSLLLDNVVLLEETIRELTGLVQVRLALGVDAI